ncbi:MAG TPA: hypothetical protein VL358_08760 [Caulobacteraceae bacterium]|jgi:hypothetical protein|nr:hypothetical protein [Caulobacteraceae bacterium]
MSRPRLRWTSAALIAAMTVSAAMFQPLASQARAAAGPPDFTGVWSRYPDPLISNYVKNAPPADPRFATPRQPAPPLKPKYQAIWDARLKELRAADERGEAIASKAVECLPTGMPTLMRDVWPIEILQTPKQINITQELYTQTRRIYMNEKQKPLDELELGYYGNSVGHWEGQTLVVDTLGIKDTVRTIAMAGRDVPHSNDMRIVEKIKFVAPDFIQDELTVIDPEVLQKPWTYVTSYKRLPETRMVEYVCDHNREYIDANGIQKRADAEAPPK